MKVFQNLTKRPLVLISLFFALTLGLYLAVRFKASSDVETLPHSDVTPQAPEETAATTASQPFEEFANESSPTTNALGVSITGAAPTEASLTTGKPETGATTGIKPLHYTPIQGQPVENIMIFPLPQNFTFGTWKLIVSPKDFRFTTSSKSPILSKAIERYRQLIFWQDTEDHFLDKFRQMTDFLDELVIDVKDSSEELQMGTDESYHLYIGYTGAKLTAPTIFGAMRGLETFSQLLRFSYIDMVYQINGAPWNITDFPQFVHRAVMIDTARHYLHVNMIKKLIDSMAYAKLNVLHWHLVDSNCFPFEVKALDLWASSYSTEERYTQAMIKNVVRYALERGVRVIPEYDGPGHMTSWMRALKRNDLIFGDNAFCLVVPIADVTNEFVYDVVKVVMDESGSMFPDKMIHLGGDEVGYPCYNRTGEWMEAHNITEPIDVLYYYMNRTQQMAFERGKNPINWDDAWSLFHDRHDLDKRLIFNLYQDINWIPAVTSEGFRVIVSPSRFYYLEYDHVQWEIIYKTSLYTNVKLGNRHLVLGATAAMWGEYADSSNFLSKIYPKAITFAERMWTDWPGDSDEWINKLLPRMRQFRFLLLERGVPASPIATKEVPGPGSYLHQ